MYTEGMEIKSTDNTADGLTATRYAAIIDGTEVGYLLAHTSGLILNVEVDDDHQGEGIATRLYQYADAAQGLYHVPSWGRTEDGERWATRMGGDTMDDEQAAAIVGMDLSIYDAA